MKIVSAAVLGFGVLAGTFAHAASAPDAEPPIRLQVDATDVVRGVYHVDEDIPATPGRLTLRFVKWLPGHHAASGRVDDIAGLVLSASGKTLPWVRDPNDMYAFSIAVPEGEKLVHAHFDFMTPLQPGEGRVSMTPQMLELEWDMVTMYPEPQPADAIRIEPTVRLPAGWDFATALAPLSLNGHEPAFAVTDLATLIDSPVLAAPTLQRTDLGFIGSAPVRIDLAQDVTASTVMTDDRIKAYREMVRQLKLVFGSQPPFAHYDTLLTVSDLVGPIGWEHQQSSEVGVGTSLYRDWSSQAENRTVLPHEFIHAWNGKYRRPEGLRSPNFSTPMSGSLLWVYEGLTEYYTVVVSARSGILSSAEAHDYLAAKAVRLSLMSGREWRTLADTTNEPAINPFHTHAAYPDWRRNASDYYDEGILIWLEVDAKVRELTGGRKTLDDFAANFYQAKAPTLSPDFYTLNDLIGVLNSVAPYDWAAFFQHRVDEVQSHPAVAGIEAAGWKVTYGPTPSVGLRSGVDALDLLDTVGLSVSDKGEVVSVRWDGPASKAGLTPGAAILAVNGIPYSKTWFRSVVAMSASKPGPITLIVNARGQVSTLTVDYHGGLLYPHLERRPGSADLLSDILAPRTGASR